MYRFFKRRLRARKFKNSSSTETPVGPGRPSRAWVRTDYNLASVSSKGRKFGVRPVLGKIRTDWTLGNTAPITVASRDQDVSYPFLRLPPSSPSPTSSFPQYSKSMNSPSEATADTLTGTRRGATRPPPRYCWLPLVNG